MAKRADKKDPNRVTRNSERRNGKAWKKNPKSNWVGSRKPRRNRPDFLSPQKRNEFGHVIKIGADGHEIAICDHPRGYKHEKISA